MTKWYRSTQVNGWVSFLLLIYLMLIYVFLTVERFDGGLFLRLYTLGVAFYILSRFLLAYFYEPVGVDADMSYEPTVSFIVPCKNEQGAIGKTIEKIVAVDYPAEKRNIILINDGSTDNTLEEMQDAAEAARRKGIHVEIIDWKVNRGKRHGMAAGMRASKQEILVFIDSDSFVEQDAVRHLVKYFTDRRVGAVSAHTEVFNENTNFLTKMQAVRYYMDFTVYKAAEGLFGSVTCCPGCCSAYRREYVVDFLDAWENQLFMGAPCQYNDDRSLTNYMLERNYLVHYAAEAIAYTIVPETWKVFWKQQLRWSKAWILETGKATRFMWRKNILMSTSFYLGSLLTALAPAAAIRVLFFSNTIPITFLVGIALIAFIYSLYYYLLTNRPHWLFGMAFSFIYAGVLIWQLPWALFHLRDSRWGTR